YLGWVRAGRWGATLVGLAFVLPSFLMVFALAALYVAYGGSLPWLQGAFYGMGAAVIGIIANHADQLERRLIGADLVLWLLFAIGCAVTIYTEAEMVWTFLIGGAVVVLVRTPPRFRAPKHSLTVVPWTEWMFIGLHGPASASDLWQILWYFTEAGAFVF